MYLMDTAQSLVSKWSAKHIELEQALKKATYSKEEKDVLVKKRPHWYPSLEKELYTDIRTKLGKGLLVTPKWIRIHMKVYTGHAKRHVIGNR